MRGRLDTLTPEEVPHEVPGLSLGMLGLSYAIGNRKPRATSGT